VSEFWWFLSHKAIYALPVFNEAEQLLYFEFTAREIDAAKKYRTIKAQIHFMLSLGYFKAKQQFYRVNLRQSQDAKYVFEKYFYKTNTKLLGKINLRTYHKQKKDTLVLLGYKNWSSEYKPQVESYICELLKFYPKSHNALRQLLNYFDNHQIIIPTYRTLQDMFTAAFSVEDKRLETTISSISKRKQKQLSALINRKNGISKLSIIRTDQKDFHYTSVVDEIKKAHKIAALYKFAKNFIPKLNISKNAVRYYADIVEQYATSRLRRLSKSQQLLHAICFIYNRYQQIMDNLIISFIYHTRLITSDGKAYADDALMKHASGMVVDFPRLAQFLKWFPIRDRELAHDELDREAYSILPEDQFPTMAEYFDGNTFDKKAAKWKFYLSSARLFALYLRPILIAGPFVFYKKNNNVIELINLLKKHYSKGKAPSAFVLPENIEATIPKNMLQYLKREPTDKNINPHLFEFFVYQKVYHHIDRGRLCCNDSVSYCDIDCDLVDEALVDDVEKIAAEFGYPKIPIYCDKRLDDAVEALNNAWDVTIKNISENNNPGFNIKVNKDGKQDWSLLYDSSEPLDDAFFKTLPKTEIADIIMFISDRIGMLDGFTHMKDRYIKRKKPDLLAISACLLLEAFGFSTTKMAEMSDIKLSLLKSTREDFIHIDTLCAVNDMLANHIRCEPWRAAGEGE